MSEAEHITEIQDIKSLNTPRIHFHWERVLASVYFTVNGCRTGGTATKKGRGGEPKHSELFPPVPSQKNTEKNINPARK